MPLSGVSVNNPQEQNPVAAISPTTTTGQVNYGGNALGSGASTSNSAISNILVYGALGLAAIFIVQRLEK